MEKLPRGYTQTINIWLTYLFQTTVDHRLEDLGHEQREPKNQ